MENAGPYWTWAATRDGCQLTALVDQNVMIRISDLEAPAQVQADSETACWKLAIIAPGLSGIVLINR